MNPIYRTLGLSLLLLLGFFTVAATLQWWLRRESRRLHDAEVATRLVQVRQVLALAPRAPGAWDSAYARSLGLALDGEVHLVPAGALPASPAAHPADELAVECELPGHPAFRVRLDFSSSAGSMTLHLHQRTLAATAALALVLLLVPIVLALARKPAAEAGSRSPWPRAASDRLGVEHFARISVERTEELVREADARRRAEENLAVNRSLLDHAHEERVRLGRELHDNICQTLYAVSLTLESVGKKIHASPEIAGRLDHCLQELRRLNQEVRTHLRELEPAEIQRQSFAEALEQLLATLPAGSQARIVQQFAADTVALIPSRQAADVINVLREAISNAIRHGAARTITLRAERGDDVVAFAVQDDGCGFDPAPGRRGPGYGLANMQARAEALGGTVRVDSALGKGTRVLLTLPVVSPT
jgi:signal transduction histidine kinase